MPRAACQKGLKFESSLLVGTRWKPDTEEKILGRLADISSGFSVPSLSSIFEYKAIVKVAAHFYTDKRNDTDIAKHFWKQIRSDCMSAQGHIVAAYAKLPAAGQERRNLREFQTLMLDTLQLFRNAAGVVSERLILAPLPE